MKIFDINVKYKNNELSIIGYQIYIPIVWYSNCSYVDTKNRKWINCKNNFEMYKNIFLQLYKINNENF